MAVLVIIITKQWRGKKDAFKKQFVENNVYRRWENYGTYYTAIDYGTVTIANGDNHYKDEKVNLTIQPNKKNNVQFKNVAITGNVKVYDDNLKIVIKVKKLGK